MYSFVAWMLYLYRILHIWSVWNVCKSIPLLKVRKSRDDFFKLMFLPKKQTNVSFLEDIEGTKKTFRSHLTFTESHFTSCSSLNHRAIFFPLIQLHQIQDRYVNLFEGKSLHGWYLVLRQLDLFHQALLYQSSQNGNTIWTLLHNFWANQELDTLITSKWPSESQFGEKK